MIFWGAGEGHKKNRQLWSGFVCPLILAHYNAQSCPHTVELLTNLREFHSARRRGEGPQYGPSWFFLSLLGAFSGLLGPFRAFSGPCWFKKVTINRRLVVIFGQFFFIKTIWCHLFQRWTEGLCLPFCLSPWDRYRLCSLRGGLLYRMHWTWHSLISFAAHASPMTSNWLS